MKNAKRCITSDVSPADDLVGNTKRLRMAESPLAESPLSSKSLNPCCGIAGIKIKLDGDDALEIRSECALVTDLCVFCDPSTHEQANLSKAVPKSFSKDFSALMHCKKCGRAACNICVGLLIRKMKEQSGCDPNTLWRQGMAFLQAVAENKCSSTAVLVCNTAVGHCCEHKDEINALKKGQVKRKKEQVRRMHEEPRYGLLY